MLRAYCRMSCHLGYMYVGDFQIYNSCFPPEHSAHWTEGIRDAASET